MSRCTTTPGRLAREPERASATGVQLFCWPRLGSRSIISRAGVATSLEPRDGPGCPDSKRPPPQPEWMYGPKFVDTPTISHPSLLDARRPMAASPEDVIRTRLRALGKGRPR